MASVDCFRRSIGQGHRQCLSAWSQYFRTAARSMQTSITYVLDPVRLIAIAQHGDEYIENGERSDIFGTSPTSANRSDRSLWRRHRRRNGVVSLRHGRSFRGQVLGDTAGLSSVRRRLAAAVHFVFGCHSHFLVHSSSSFSTVFTGSQIVNNNWVITSVHVSHITLRCFVNVLVSC